MTCTSNGFHTHPILQIWPPATTACLQTSKEYSIERDFEAKDKLFYKKSIELLEKCWNQCITLEGDYTDE